MSWLERIAHLWIEGLLVYLVVEQLAEPGQCPYCLARTVAGRARGCWRVPRWRRTKGKEKRAPIVPSVPFWL